jgi:hypothetical protein
MSARQRKPPVVEFHYAMDLDPAASVVLASDYEVIAAELRAARAALAERDAQIAKLEALVRDMRPFVQATPQ